MNVLTNVPPTRDLCHRACLGVAQGFVGVCGHDDVGALHDAPEVEERLLAVLHQFQEAPVQPAVGRFKVRNIDLKPVSADPACTGCPAPMSQSLPSVHNGARLNAGCLSVKRRYVLATTVEHGHDQSRNSLTEGGRGQHRASNK